MREVARAFALLLCGAAVGLCGATVGIVPHLVSAGTALAGKRVPTTIPACPPPKLGRVACLARHVVNPNFATANPTGLIPKAISTAYAFPQSGGTGETIGIVDAYNDPTATSNLATFSSEFGLAPCTISNGCFAQVNQTGGSSLPHSTTMWAFEISLDIEWAHALAPNAHILLVEANSTSYTNMFAAVRYTAQHAQYVNMSWGGTEFVGESTFDSTFTSYPGVSFFAASGDKSKQVSYPSASPDVISVGGTTLTVTSKTFAWGAETGWSTSGGGCSRYEKANAAQAAYPTYDQTGANCVGWRAAPDVAFDGSPTKGVAVYDTWGVTKGWMVVGGTSVSAVLMTGRSAISAVHVNAAYVYGSSIKLYNVTTGWNGHPCKTGYNLCTGLGSWNTAVGVIDGSTGGTLSFTPVKQTLTAGVPSSAMTVHLSAPAPSGGLSVSLSSSSGGFSSSSSGPFATPLTVTVAGGTSASPTFYFETSKGGTAKLSASASGWSPGSQTETVSPGPLAKIAISPSSATVTEGSSQVFSATGYDTYGNVEAVSPTWSIPSGVGTLTPASGSKTTFTAASSASGFTLSASQNGVTGTASVSVVSDRSLSFTPAKVTLTAGISVPMTVHLSTAAPSAGLSVMLSATSGGCAATPSGPFTTPLTVTVAGGTMASPTFDFETNKSGTVTLSATATGSTGASETDHVSAGPLAKIVVSPASASVAEGASQLFSASGYDAHGNPVSVSPTWSIPAGVGKLTPTTGPSATFKAGLTPASFTLSATSGTVVGTASVTVTGPSSMTVSITDRATTKSGRKYKVPLTVTSTGTSGPISGATVTLRIYSGTCTGTLVTSYTGTTGSTGTASFTFATSKTGSYCASTTVTASGYRTGTGTLSFSITATATKKALVTRLLADRLR